MTKTLETNPGEQTVQSFNRIFWDWGGVLGTQEFWHLTSLRDVQLRQFKETIFRDKTLLYAWMRGQTSLADIVQAQKFALTAETLGEILLQDWRGETAINTQLFGETARRYPGAEHYMSTDNMDVFVAFASNNEFIQRNFAGVYNSAEYGMLKDDQPGLFEYIRDDLGLHDFSEALLLDDSPMNCRRFELLGGKAILVEKG